jgi:hypothetical protein
VGRKPVGKVAMTSAERQRLYMRRLRDTAAAVTNGKQPGPRQIVTDGMTGRQMEAIGGTGLSTHAKAALKRMARHKRSSVAVLVEKWITATENRLAGTLKGAALKRYYDGE